MLEVKNLMVFFENALALNSLSLEVRSRRRSSRSLDRTVQGKPP